MMQEDECINLWSLGEHRIKYFLILELITCKHFLNLMLI